MHEEGLTCALLKEELGLVASAIELSSSLEDEPRAILVKEGYKDVSSNVV